MDITIGCVDKNEFERVVVALKEARYLIGVKPENRAFICKNHPEAREIVKKYILSGKTRTTGYI